MMVQARPKAWVHENVPQCPAKELLNSVLGYLDALSTVLHLFKITIFGDCQNTYVHFYDL